MIYINPELTQRTGLEMLYYDESTIPICDECKSLELKIKHCNRCDKRFCKHYSSELDPKYCINCMGDVKVERFIVTKKVEYSKKSTGEKITRNYGKYIMTKLSGDDFLYAEHRISTLCTEEEYARAIEYHDAMKSLLINSREDMRRARMDKLRGVKIHIAKPNGEVKKKAAAKIVQDPNTIRATIAASLSAVFGTKPTEQQIDAVLAQMAAIQQGS